MSTSHTARQSLMVEVLLKTNENITSDEGSDNEEDLILALQEVETSQQTPRQTSNNHADKGSDNEEDLVSALQEVETSQQTPSQTAEYHASSCQTNSQADCRLIRPTASEEILWKGHLTKFDLASFREFQIEVINAIEKGNDLVVVQRTGSGKSLVYQVPSLFSSVKYTIVVCPTISLILNQVNHLKEKGIDAIPFLPVRTKRKTLRDSTGWKSKSHL